MAYDYDHNTADIPLEYARALVNVAEEINRRVESAPLVYGKPFVIERVMFWDGMNNERSEWFIDVHDDAVWISLATETVEETEDGNA